MSANDIAGVVLLIVFIVMGAVIVWFWVWKGGWRLLRGLLLPPDVSPGNLVAAGIMTLVIGAVIVGIGTVLVQSEVTCGDRVMRSGDTCVTSTSGGRVVGRTSYREAQESQQSFGGFVLIVGGLAVAGGITWTVWGSVTGFRALRSR